MKILIFILILSSLYSQIIYNASDFIELIRNSTPANESDLKGAIENTKAFLKHYIYYKVATDPPQPDFDNNYFPKFNFSSHLII